jgi:hypothetical protein
VTSTVERASPPSSRTRFARLRRRSDSFWMIEILEQPARRARHRLGVGSIPELASAAAPGWCSRRWRRAAGSQVWVLLPARSIPSVVQARPSMSSGPPRVQAARVAQASRSSTSQDAVAGDRRCRCVHQHHPRRQRRASRGGDFPVEDADVSEASAPRRGLIQDVAVDDRDHQPGIALMNSCTPGRIAEVSFDRATWLIRLVSSGGALHDSCRHTVSSRTRPASTRASIPNCRPGRQSAPTVPARRNCRTPPLVGADGAHFTSLG